MIVSYRLLPYLSHSIRGRDLELIAGSRPQALDLGQEFPRLQERLDLLVAVHVRLQHEYRNPWCGVLGAFY